jgi:TolB-like protein
MFQCYGTLFKRGDVTADIRKVFHGSLRAEQDTSDEVEIGSCRPVSREGVAKSSEKLATGGQAAPAIYAFGPFRLDEQGETLFRGTERVALSHRAVALLCLLVDRAGAPVSKDALMEAAWPSLAVEENNLTVQIAALRRALAAEPGGDKWIETLPRRGYRFVGPVAKFAAPDVDVALPLANTESALALPTPQTPSLPLPGKPSIAVMPFVNLSGDPEQEYFADGMVEEIITALCRIRWLFVIARDSSFTYKGQTVDVKRVGHELGVRYVLEGSVRKAAGRVRISWQLIEAETNAHIWADRFDGSLEDVFELQDQVAASVAGVIEPTLQAAEGRRTAGRPTNDLTAYDLHLRALATYYPITRQRAIDTLKLLRQAVAIDQDYGPALSWTAIVLMRLYREGWAEDPETTGREAVELARHALQIANDDPGVVTNAAFVLANFGEHIGAMIGLVDRALVLTPSFARGWFICGVLQLWAGQHDVAIEHAKAMLRLSPRERSGTPFSLIGEAHFYKHEFEEAAAQLLLSIHNNPGFPHSFQVLAACYGLMGRFEEARAIVDRLQKITPQIVPSVAHLRLSKDRDLFLSGMRLAAGSQSAP